MMPVHFDLKIGKKTKKLLDKTDIGYILYNMLRGGAVVARQAHNLKAVGSIPAPATK